MSEKTTLAAAISAVQNEVVVPKARYNQFGKFNYRSFEDIVAAVKKPCKEHGIGFSFSDEIVPINNRFYVKTTLTVFLLAQDEHLEFTAYARESDEKKGSDPAQITGMASSYARKYALCGAFAIDGEADPDAIEHNQIQTQPLIAHCTSCGARYQFDTPEQYNAFISAPGCCQTPNWVVET